MYDQLGMSDYCFYVCATPDFNLFKINGKRGDFTLNTQLLKDIVKHS